MTADATAAPDAGPSALEWWFTAVSLVFFSGAVIPLLRAEAGFQIDGSESDPISLVIEFVIYGVAAILIATRTRSLCLKGPALFLWSVIAATVVSAAWSEVPDITARKALLSVGTTVFGVYAGLRFTLRQQLLIIAVCVLALAAASAAVAIMRPDIGLDMNLNAGAWRGIFVNKNVLGRIMALGFVAALVSTFAAPRGRVAYALAAAGLAFAIPACQSASASVVMLLSPGVLLLWGCWKHPSIGVPVAVAAAALGVGIVGHYGPERALNVAIDALGRDSTLTGRTSLWQTIFGGIQARPWLGYGYQAFWTGEDGPGGAVWTVTGWRAPNGHNGLIDLTLDLGLVGAVLFLAGYVWTWVKAIRAVRVCDGAGWAIAYLAFLFIYNSTESTLLKPNNIFWVLFVSIAAALAVPLQPRTEAAGVRKRATA